ncbi:MAG: DUF4277 domain-containing protein [bacterium]
MKGSRGDRHPPYQGGQGGSNLKSIFNLIITSYLYLFSQFFKDKEIEELLGEEIKTDYINDDIIGRVMDEFRIVE